MGTGVYRRAWTNYPGRRKVYPLRVSVLGPTPYWNAYHAYAHNLARKFVYRQPWLYAQLTRFARVMPITITGPLITDREGLVPLLTVRPMGALNVG